MDNPIEFSGIDHWQLGKFFTKNDNLKLTLSGLGNTVSCWFLIQYLGNSLDGFEDVSTWWGHMASTPKIRLGIMKEVSFPELAGGSRWT